MIQLVHWQNAVLTGNHFLEGGQRFLVDSVSMGYPESESTGCHFGTPGEFSQDIKQNGRHEKLNFPISY